MESNIDPRPRTGLTGPPVDEGRSRLEMRSPMALRILIVEDDALTAAAFAAALYDAGHLVVAIADTARAAVINAGEVQADLALVDITLRDGRTGLAAARALHDDH